MPVDLREAELSGDPEKYGLQVDEARRAAGLAFGSLE